LGRYWGVVVAIIIAIGDILGGPSAAFYAAMTVLVIVWSLGAAPSWCGALNRRRGDEMEYCRNNSSGLLPGCWIRQHRYQKFTQAWWSTSWRDRTRGFLGGIQAKVAAAVTVFGVVVGTIGLIVDIPEIAKMIACG
jgi:hypothetical protein